jgi:hypothetical protein
MPQKSGPGIKWVFRIAPSDWGHCSVVECLSTIYTVLGLSPSTIPKKELYRYIANSQKIMLAIIVEVTK